VSSTTVTAGMGSLLAERQLVVFVGEGGVGKTSSAAACAIAAAAAGRRTAIITIDPAPRLGDALGVSGFGEEPRPVDLRSLHAPTGSLVAMRLDTQRTFDRVVEHLSPSAESARAILENPVYKTISGSLGGSECYMAFQRLYEVLEHGAYDLVVVDTPPAVHARDLFGAPLRLAALLDTGAAAILANPALVIARASSAIARTTAAAILPLLERATGIELHRQVAEFISNFEIVLRGLRARAETIEQRLRRADTAFIEVVRPSSECVGRAIALEGSLSQMGIAIDAIVVNRVTPPAGPDRDEPLLTRTAGAPPGTLDALALMESEIDAMRAAEAEAVARLHDAVRMHQARTRIFESTALDHDVASLEDLSVLAAALSGDDGFER